MEYPEFFSQRQYPVIMQLYQSTSTLEMERIRLFFFAPHLMKDRFLVVHQPQIQSLPVHSLDVEITDRSNSQGQSLLAINKGLMAVTEYFISMRPAWLCYRCGSSVILEGYRPNRAARQFGYHQAAAINTLPIIADVDMNKINDQPTVERLNVAAAVYTHLLRLGTGAKFKIAPPSSCTGLSFKYLQWVRLSFASITEKGTRKYEKKVLQLGVSLAQRMQHKAQHQHNNDKGKAVEVSVEAGPVIHSKRSRSREPSPSQAEEPSTSQRPRLSPQLASPPPVPPHVPRKWPSPLYCRQASPQINAEDPIASNDSVLADTPKAAESFLDSLFSAPPYCSPYVDEENLTAPTYPPSAHCLDMMPSSFQFSTHDSPEVTPTSEIKGVQYQSNIHHRYPMPVDQQNDQVQRQNMIHLANLIERIRPSPPEVLDQFVRHANLTLDYMAGIGIEEEVLRYWESLCRGAEYLIWQMKSLGIVRCNTSLDDLQEEVRIRREEADILQDKIRKDIEELEIHEKRLDEASERMTSATQKIRKIWKELKDAVTCKTNLQAQYDQELHMWKALQNRQRRHLQAKTDADAAAIRAEESLTAAEEEAQALDNIGYKFEKLWAKIPQL